VKKILAVLAAGAMIGAFAGSYAKLPPAPPKSDAEKKAEADKAAANKAKDAQDVAKAEEKAIANYKKNQAAKK
jgi:gas vesicle protein